MTGRSRLIAILSPFHAPGTTRDRGRGGVVALPPRACDFRSLVSEQSEHRRSEAVFVSEHGGVSCRNSRNIAGQRPYGTLARVPSQGSDRAVESVKRTA